MRSADSARASMSGAAPAAAIAIRTEHLDAQPPPPLSPMSDTSERSDDAQPRPGTSGSQKLQITTTISPVSNERSTSSANPHSSLSSLAPPSSVPPFSTSSENGERFALKAEPSPRSAMVSVAESTTSPSAPQALLRPSPPPNGDSQHRSNLRNLLLEDMGQQAPRQIHPSQAYPAYSPAALRASTSPPSHHPGLHTPAASHQEEISPTTSDPSGNAAVSGSNTGTPHNDGTSPAGARPKKTSCDRCHTRKIRVCLSAQWLAGADHSQCDHQKPACSTCRQRNVPCVYSVSAPKSMYRQGKPSPTHLGHRPQHLAIQPSGHSPISPTYHPSQTPQSAHPHSALSDGATRPRWASIPVVGDRSTAGKLTYSAMLDHDRRLRALGGFENDTDEALYRQQLDKIIPGDVTRRESKDVDELESDTDGPTYKRKVEDTSMDIDLEKARRKQARTSFPEGMSNMRPMSRDHHDLGLSRSPSDAGLPDQNSRYPRSVLHAYVDPLTVLKQSLPSASISGMLFTTVFTDPFMTEGIAMLIPHFTEEYNRMTSREQTQMGDATTLALAFTFLAAGYAILPSEMAEVMVPPRTGKATPRSLASTLVASAQLKDTTTMEVRWFDNALLASQVSEQHESLSVLLVVLKLMQFRYLSIRKGNWTTYAGGFLTQAIKLAQTLGMSKEWDGIPAIERELRRRLMWALYVTDRQHSLDTLDPYTIIDAHQGIHLPSPMTEADLYRLPADVKSLPAVETDNGPTANTALFIHVHLARRLTALLDSFCTIGPNNTPSDMLLRLDQSLEGFYNMLPPYLRPFPQTDTSFDSANPYLVPHRLRLHVTLLSIRLSLYRAHLSQYLRSTSSRAVRATIAQICQGALRTQRSAKMLDSKIAPRLFSKVIVFEATMTLALIMYAENALDGNYKESSAYERTYERIMEGLEMMDVTAPPSAVKALRAVLAKSDEAARV